MSNKESFKEHFETLKTIANELRNEGEIPDIDSYVDKIEKAKKAYEFCTNHIAKIQKAIEENTSNSNDNSDTRLDSDAPSTLNFEVEPKYEEASNVNYDDDIPF